MKITWGFYSYLGRLAQLKRYEAEEKATGNMPAEISLTSHRKHKPYLIGVGVANAYDSTSHTYSPPRFPQCVNKKKGLIKQTNFNHS